MRYLLCLLGLHHYRKPTHDGGMRCKCGRVQYRVHW